MPEIATQKDPMSLQFDCLQRQTSALEYIACRIDEMMRRTGQPSEMPLNAFAQYELAKRRLIEETV